MTCRWNRRSFPRPPRRCPPSVATVRFIPSHYILALTRAEAMELIVALSVLDRDYETSDTVATIRKALWDGHRGDLPQTFTALQDDDDEGDLRPA